jgi:hypothetical protein
METFEAKNIRRFEIAYVAESYYGDTLFFFKEEKEDGSFDIEIRKQNGDVVVRSKVVFE